MRLRRTDMRIEGLHHVAIIASDYARSKRFYTEVLGLRVVAEHYRAERDSWKLDLALPDGTQVELELTVEHRRKRIAATVKTLPFLDLERKRA